MLFFVSLFLEKKKISASMEPLQIFHILIVFIADGGLTNQPMIMPSMFEILADFPKQKCDKCVDEYITSTIKIGKEEGNSRGYFPSRISIENWVSVSSNTDESRQECRYFDRSMSSDTCEISKATKKNEDYSLQLFAEHFDAVLVDSELHLNYLAALTSSGAQEAQKEAIASLQWLCGGMQYTHSSKQKFNSDSDMARKAFEVLFVEGKQESFLSRYDAYVLVPFQDPNDINMNSYGNRSNGADGLKFERGTPIADIEGMLFTTEQDMMLDLPASHWLCRQLPLLLSEALKDRIHSVVARIFTKTADVSFAIQDSLATALGDTETAIRRNSCYITISDEEQLQMVLTKNKKEDCCVCMVILGLHLNSSNMNRVVDRGPNADDLPAVYKFRNFWGSKSELRRFRDGAIVEALIWEQNNDFDKDGVILSKTTVVEAICRYILTRHCPQWCFIHSSPDVQQKPTVLPQGHMAELDEKRRDFASSCAKRKRHFKEIQRTNMNVLQAKRKRTLEADKITFIGTQMEAILLDDGISFNHDYFSAVQRCLAVLEALHSKLKILNKETIEKSCSLPFVPLKIVSLLPVAPQLRYTSLSPPRPIDLLLSSRKGINMTEDSGEKCHNQSKDTFQKTQMLYPLEVVIRLEESSAWPDDLKSLRAAKTAFLLRMCQILRRSTLQHKVYRHKKKYRNKEKVNSGDDEAQNLTRGECNKALQEKEGKSFVQSSITAEYADIIFHGFLFRLRLAVDKEVALVPVENSDDTLQKPYAQKRSRNPKELSFPNQTKRAMISSTPSNISIWGGLAGVAERWRLHIFHTIMPQHHSMIHAIATQHTAFSPSVRLAILWLHTHRLSNQIPQSAVELLVAKAFLQDKQNCLHLNSSARQSIHAPATSLRGFYSFLLLLATHDWHTTPLIVENSLDIPCGADDGDLIDENFIDIEKAANHYAANVRKDYDTDNSKLSKNMQKSLLCISKSDRLKICRVFKDIRSLQNEHQTHAIAASTMWIVAPYDRCHGWLSSWGISHGHHPLSCFYRPDSIATKFPDYQQREFHVSFQHDCWSHGIHTHRETYCGPDRAVLKRIQSIAHRSLIQLRYWVQQIDVAHPTRILGSSERQRFNNLSTNNLSFSATPQSIEDEKGADDIVRRVSKMAFSCAKVAITQSFSGWRNLFTPCVDGRQSLGANVVFSVNPRFLLTPVSRSKSNGEISFSSITMNNDYVVEAKACTRQTCHTQSYKNVPKLINNRTSNGTIRQNRKSSILKSNTSNSSTFSANIMESHGVESRFFRLGSTLNFLRSRFGHLASFFVNILDPREVFVVWKPAVFLLIQESYHPLGKEMTSSSFPANWSYSGRQNATFYQGHRVFGHLERVDLYDSEGTRDHIFATEGEMHDQQYHFGGAVGVSAKTVGMKNTVELTYTILQAAGGWLENPRFL